MANSVFFQGKQYIPVGTSVGLAEINDGLE